MCFSAIQPSLGAIRICCNQREMLLRLITNRFFKPCPGSGEIVEGLLGTKGFGDADDQRARRVKPMHGAVQVKGVDIRAEAEIDIARGFVLERVDDQARTEIRPADADVENGIER